MAELPHADYLADRLRIKLELVIPAIPVRDDYEQWALTLLGQQSWSCGSEWSGLSSIEEQKQLYLQAFLQALRLFCQLGRLPVFDIPRVVSLRQDGQNAGKYQFVIEIVRIQFLPQDVYKTVIKVSLDLCQWMAHNSPTQENKTKVFNTVIEAVIKPLHRSVPFSKSTIALLNVAHRLGIPFVHLGIGVYQLGWGSKARRIERSTCELDSAIGSQLAQHKPSTAAILRTAGLPAPVHQVVMTESDAMSSAARIGFPLVVKPADLDRGEGVTVDIGDEPGLKIAFGRAQKLSKSRQVIVERQVPGVCHRFFVANGRLLYAVKRHPMSVVADGERTIQQLVDDAVAAQSRLPPWDRSEIRSVDELAVKSIQSLGLSADSVPGKNVMIPLRRIESTEWGGVDEDVTSVVHPENREIALQAARLFDLHIAGIDIISADITKPWHCNGAIINEVNFAPLFGGAAISRSYIPAFFSEFIEGDGKIPIEIFETRQAALAFQQQQRRQGRRCYFTSASQTLDESGKEVVMDIKGIKQRLQALLLWRNVDAISVFKSSL